MNRSLAKEFHHEGIEDVLGLEAILWHAWSSVRDKDIVSDVDSTRTDNISSLPVKRAPIDVNDTLQAKKKIRRLKKKHSDDDNDRVLRHCPDPACASRTAHERVYSWVALYQHMYVTRTHIIGHATLIFLLANSHIIDSCPLCRYGSCTNTVRRTFGKLGTSDESGSKR